MTDKQIIFDDVDVKDCIAYAKLQEIYLGNTLYKQMEKICMVKNQPCKFFDCQFKQMARELKRSEAQCEAMFVTHTDLEKDYKAKEQECDELKKNYFTVIQQRNKAEQTLTEIKEIAEAESYLSPQSTRLLVHKILQKISECEGNNEYS